MNYLLLQNFPCINDLTESLTSKYPASSIVKTSESVFPKGYPLLTEKWIIILYLSNRNCLKQLLQAKSMEDSAYFIFVTSNNLEVIQTALNEKGFEYNVINNISISKKELVRYTRTKLGITNELALKIVKKSKYYEPLVIKNVQLLSIVKDKQLDSLEVDKYLIDSSCASFNYLYRYIILREGEYRKIIELVNRYQNNIYVLCNFIIRKLEDDIRLFELIIDGYLTKENYIVYSLEKKLPLYNLQQTIELFEKLTLETLYTKLLLFRSLKNSNCVEFIMKGCKT